MVAAAPRLRKARVVELPEFYSSSATGVDALAAFTTALSRHAGDADATALLLGHNPGWEEAVALLTCNDAAAKAAPEATAPAGPVAEPMRTAQGALLRSETRSWRDALTAGWARRGDVAPPPRKEKKQQQDEPSTSE